MTDIAAPAKPRSPARYLLMATLRAFNANKTSWIGLVVFALVVMLALLEHDVFRRKHILSL